MKDHVVVITVFTTATSMRLPALSERDADAVAMILNEAYRGTHELMVEIAHKGIRTSTYQRRPRAADETL